MFKAIIFDLDGTLVDTIEDIAAAVNSALVSFGFPTHASGDYYRLVGNGMRNLVRNAAPVDFSDEAVLDACVAQAVREYAEKPAVFSKAYPGVPELLNELRARKMPAAILSNKPDGLTLLVVKAVLGNHSFSAVQGEKTGVPRKPDPTSALAIAALLGAKPREVLYLGDSDVDMHTARNAGFFAAGAAWGFRGSEELEAAGAQAMIESPIDLLKLLDSPSLLTKSS
ncbi:MAG: HAD family hydrolase [Treponemataceae bacterium]